MADKWPFCSPPIWDRKNFTWDGKNLAWDRKKTRNFSAESPFPTPDWGSVGPVLNYKDEKKSGIEFEENTVANGSPSFARVKDISAECPISRALPCAVPFNILKKRNVNINSNHFFKSRLSEEVKDKFGCLNYTEDNSLWPNGFNGRLDSLCLQGENYIVHPEWREGRQWIVVSNIKNETPLNLIPGETEGNIIFGNTEEILPSEEVCQIISKNVGDNGFALLRSKKDVSLVYLNGDLENSGFESTFGNSGCWTVCSSLSSQVPGLWSVVYEDGTVEVHPAEGPQIWRTRLHPDSNIGQLRWYGCEFGHHPMSLLIAGRSNLFLADLRTAGSRRDNAVTAQRNIFKTENLASFIDPNEQICTFKKCENKPYVYAVLNKTVLMFDIRHCKVPCMKWQHMMPSKRPTYASTVNTDGKEECLILGSKDQQNVCFLAGMWEQGNNEIRYSAVGLPNHVNLIRDSAEMMNREEILLSAAAKERLRSNMIGMVPVNLTNGKEFYLITLNSPGDLIYQKFKYNRKEEFSKASHSTIEAWKTWEKAISLENSLDIPEFELDTANILYGTKYVEKKVEDTDEVDEIFDDLPINYDLSELFRENYYKALPPLVSSWNINDKLKEKKERLLRWEKRGTDHGGRKTQVSMNTILVKNYKVETEFPENSLRKVKKKYGIEKNNKDMDTVLNKLPHSVVSSLNPKRLLEYKDTFSSSVLSGWKTSKINVKEQEQKKRRRCSNSDDITVKKTPKTVKLENSRKDMLMNTNNRKGIPAVKNRTKNKFAKRNKPKVEYFKLLKEKTCNKRLNVSLSKIENDSVTYSKCNAIDKIFLDRFKEKGRVKAKNDKKLPFYEHFGLNHNNSVKGPINKAEKKSVGSKTVEHYDKQDSEIILMINRKSNNSLNYFAVKKNSKVDKDAINGINKKKSKQKPIVNDVYKEFSNMDENKLLKDMTNSSRERKVKCQKKINKNKKSVENKKRKTNSNNKNKNEGLLKLEDLKLNLEDIIIPAKRGTLKYLKQRENFMKNQLVEFKDQNDLFASKAMKKNSFCGSLLESESADESMDFYSPDHKRKKRQLRESSPITPRTEILGEWTENGVQLAQGNVGGWNIATDNDVNGDHKKIVMTVTYHMQQQNKSCRRTSKRLSSVFPKLESGKESYKMYSPLVYSQIHFPRASVNDFADKCADESQDEYFDSS